MGIRSRGDSLYTLNGLIASVGFASGDRIVVGSWADGPLGPMNDVMWADPSGKRTLLAPNDGVGQFVSAIYHFDNVEVLPDLTVRLDASGFHLESRRLCVSMRGGRSRAIRLLPLRSRTVTRFIEGPIAAALLGVHTYGVTSNGIEEWYQATRYTAVVEASASIDNVDLGAMTDVRPGLKVGFSEPPSRPSIVRVRIRLRDRTGILAGLTWSPVTEALIASSTGADCRPRCDAVSAVRRPRPPVHRETRGS